VQQYARLIAAADAQASDAQCWERAEWHLLGTAFRQRLASLGVDPAACSGATLIAAALFLAEYTDEWGADGRDVLGELAQLGRHLIDG
jgi:hypothetical protein